MDVELLADLIFAVEESASMQAVDLGARNKAELIARLYDQATDEEADALTVDRLVWLDGA